MALDLSGNFVPVLIKPFSTFYGFVKDNVIQLHFKDEYTGTFYSMADYWEEVE